MLTDNQLERYADVLLWGLQTARKTRFKKDDVIVVRFNLPAVRLAEMLQAKQPESEPLSCLMKITAGNMEIVTWRSDLPMQTPSPEIITN